MNTKTFYSIALLIIIGIIIGIIGTSVLGTKQQNHLQEINNSPEIEDWKKAKEIAFKDEEVQELIGGESVPVSIPFGIIPNKTYAELYLQIGGEYQEIITSNRSNGRYLTGGKIYKISIDLRNETVISAKEETNQTILNFIEETHRGVTESEEYIL